MHIHAITQTNPDFADVLLLNVQIQQSQISFLSSYFLARNFSPGNLATRKEGSCNCHKSLEQGESLRKQPLNSALWGSCGLVDE